MFEIGNFSENFELKDSSVGNIYILEEIEAIAVQFEPNAICGGKKICRGKKFCKLAKSIPRKPLNLSYENHLRY